MTAVPNPNEVLSMRFRLLAPLAVALSLLSLPSHASLTTDLQGLVAAATTLKTQLAGITLPAPGACAELGTLNTSIENYNNSVGTITAQLTAPLTLTSTDFTSLDDLSRLALDMGNNAAGLSQDLRTVEGVYQAFEYQAALSAMLRLSDDIGTMADRILEMADRILVMADNVGLMADRILITQQLQNSNVALTQAAILTTQQNMVALSDSLSTIAYNLTLGQLKIDTQALADQMGATTLTSSNMASALATLETATSALLTRTVSLYTLTMQTSQGASHYIDGDTLTLLGDLSTVNKALAAALANYANAINNLAPLTNSTVLSDATASMLRLTRDIGTMADRIVEMGDKIIVMADNIGVMSLRIVETQNLQQGNIVLTQNSVLTAQSVTLTVIKNFGL
jgi:hypothetical protein